MIILRESTTVKVTGFITHSRTTRRGVIYNTTIRVKFVHGCTMPRALFRNALNFRRFGQEFTRVRRTICVRGRGASIGLKFEFSSNLESESSSNDPRDQLLRHSTTNDRLRRRGAYEILYPRWSSFFHGVSFLSWLPSLMWPSQLERTKLMDLKLQGDHGYRSNWRVDKHWASISVRYCLGSRIGHKAKRCSKKEANDCMVSISLRQRVQSVGFAMG